MGTGVNGVDSSNRAPSKGESSTLWGKGYIKKAYTLHSNWAEENSRDALIYFSALLIIGVLAYFYFSPIGPMLGTCALCTALFIAPAIIIHHKKMQEDIIGWSSIFKESSKEDDPSLGIISKLFKNLPLPFTSFFKK